MKQQLQKVQNAAAGFVLNKFLNSKQSMMRMFPTTRNYGTIHL